MMTMGPPCAQSCPLPQCMPVGAIIGSAFTKRELVAADGTVTFDHQPVDLTQHVLEAQVGAMTFPALTRPDGTFEIDGVPAGAIWTLHYDKDYVVTTERTINLSQYATGRADLMTATTSPTNVTFNLTSLAAWQATDYVELYSAN